MAFGLTLAAVVRQYRGDDAATRELVDQALALAEAQGLAFLGAMATILDGWVIASGGAVDEGMARMRAGLAAQLATGAELARPYWLCLIAEACLWTQACDDGLELLAEAEAAVESTQERYWEAEIHRLRGEILLKTASASQARAAASSFRRALDIARRQSARTLELRAAVSLARLWQAEGRDREAYDLLAPAFGWFSEGWDTPDLQAAGALLAQLGGPLDPTDDLTQFGGGCSGHRPGRLDRGTVEPGPGGGPQRMATRARGGILPPGLRPASRRRQGRSQRGVHQRRHRRRPVDRVPRWKSRYRSC